MCEEARDIWGRTRGTSYPHRAIAMINISNIQLWRGELDAAKATIEEANRLLVEAHGDEHESTALAVQGLGDVLLARGELDAAGQAYAQANEVLEKIGFARTGSRRATLWSGIGSVRLESGDVTGAAEAFERGRAAAAELAERSIVRADLDFGLARTSWEQGQHRRAIELATQARDAVATLGPEGATRTTAIEAWLTERR
jgi:tetratricopeptide (TPR) repeat protein